MHGATLSERVPVFKTDAICVDLKKSNILFSRIMRLARPNLSGALHTGLHTSNFDSQFEIVLLQDDTWSTLELKRFEWKFFNSPYPRQVLTYNRLSAF